MSQEHILAINEEVRKSSKHNQYRNIQTPGANNQTEPLNRIGRLVAHGDEIVKNKSIKSFEGNKQPLPYS